LSNVIHPTDVESREENHRRAGPDDPLAVVTFADLERCISAKQERTTAADSSQAWQSLLTIVRDLTRSSISGGFDAVTGHHWSLIELQVSGYQGVGADHPLRMMIDPTPGITVIHGPNGAGKSSIADAIDALMHGQASGSTPVTTGSGGNTPLWNRVQCGRDADQANLQLTLSDGVERLYLTGVIDTSGVMTSWVVDHERGGERRQVKLDSTWASALAGHQPVFAYAAMERRIQTSRQLKEYLDRLIALGGCFTVLNHEVNDRSATADRAFAAWKEARHRAEQAVEAVDSLRTGSDPLPKVSWPEVSDDPDDWLQAQHLTEAGDALPEIGTDHRTEISTVAARVEAALSDLDKVRISTLDQMAGGLVRLHQEASHLSDPGRTCPVCETSDIDWRSILNASITELGRIQELSKVAAQALLTLKATVQASLEPMLAVAKVVPHPALTQAHVHGSERVQHFLRTTDREGTEPSVAVTLAARSLIGWAQSATCESLYGHTIEITDRHRQWLRARREAVAEFIEVWRTQRAEAVQSRLWELCKRHLTTLSGEMRGQRANELQERAGRRISALLHDAGIELKSIALTQTKADLQLLGPDGSAVQLGMLSSGQRNAVLLAPLLALTAGGPFDFVVLDDPVHAFDELRVDRLATLIEEVATHRRVIVLTHDERLREHLLALGTDARAHQISRDLSGAVTVAAGRAMWDVLLSDASTALALDGRGVEIASGTTDIVRGLCRQAVDDAIRTFVVRVTTQAGDDVTAALAKLDDAHTTRERLDKAKALASRLGTDPGVVAGAREGIAPYLTSWNEAAHGNPPRTPAVKSEISAARRCCRRLVEGFSV